MRTHSVRLFGLAAAAIVLASGSAAAQGKGHGNGKGEGKEHDDKGRDERVEQIDNRVPGTVIMRRDDEHRGEGRHEKNRGRDDDRRDDDRRGEGRRDDNRMVYGNGTNVPPGLAKKPGHMPPGQYKKRYGSQQGATVLGDIFGRNGYTVTRIVPTGQSQYVYYRLPDGSMQRAIVSPGTNRLQFSNVPANILQAVLAQLY